MSIFFISSQCSTTGIAKAIVCYLVCHTYTYKRSLAANSESVAHEVATAGFLFC